MGKVLFKEILFSRSGAEVRMVSLSESPANWWKEENTEESCDKSKSESQQRLLPCELIQLSPSVAKSKGYEGTTFHQITRY